MGKRQEKKQAEAGEVERMVVFMPMLDFREAALRGLFQKVVLEAGWKRFSAWGVMESGVNALLSLTRGVRGRNRAREFLNPGTALAELRKMGVTRVEVVMEEWDVEMAVLSMRQRPDVTARRLRRARMTPAETLLEMSKQCPEIAYLVPPGTVEPGPVRREEELRALEQRKLDELARRGREEDARRRAEWDAAEKAERERNYMSRAESDAISQEIWEEAQRARRKG